MGRIVTLLRECVLNQSTEDWDTVQSDLGKSLPPAVGEGQDGGNKRAAFTPTLTLPHRRGRGPNDDPVCQSLMD